MSWRLSVRVLSACLVASLMGAGVASAATPPAAAKKASAASSSASASKAGTFNDACVDGANKYISHDFQGAVEAFQKAVELAPKNPLGHYYLGEAHEAAGNLTEAEAAWNRASLAATEQDPGLRAKVLFVLADLKERQKKPEEAKAAWQVYLDWVAKYPKAGGFAGSATSRQQVIDAAEHLSKLSAAVKQRTNDTKAGGVFTDMSKQPATPLAK